MSSTTAVSAQNVSSSSRISDENAVSWPSPCGYGVCVCVSLQVTVCTSPPSASFFPSLPFPASFTPPPLPLASVSAPGSSRRAGCATQRPAARARATAPAAAPWTARTQPHAVSTVACTSIPKCGWTGCEGRVANKQEGKQSLTWKLTLFGKVLRRSTSIWLACGNGVVDAPLYSSIRR